MNSESGSHDAVRAVLVSRLKMCGKQEEGVIVDFGEHLRPSVPETKEKIDEHIEE